jgi:hypothetical protein
MPQDGNRDELSETLRVAPYEATIGSFLPNRKTGARGPPCLHHFRIRPRSGSDELEQIEYQGFYRFGQRALSNADVARRLGPMRERMGGSSSGLDAPRRTRTTRRPRRYDCLRLPGPGLVIQDAPSYDNGMGRIVQSRLDPETLDLLTRLRRSTGLSDSELLRRGLRRLAEREPRTRRLRIVGVGKFASTVDDLGSNKHRLRGFGRS